MNRDRIGLVCFDWGGVLLRICRSWDEGCERAGVPVRTGAGDVESVVRRRELSARYQRGEIDDTAFCAGVAEATGGRYSPEEVALIHDAWMIEEYKGVHEVVGELARAGRAHTGMLSNTNHRHWSRHLPGEDGTPPEFPTPSLLTHRHASHLMGLAKPDPGIYKRFERETGFAGTRILFFDDLEDNIASARDAGWHAELIDHAGDTADQIATHLARYGLL